MHFKNEVFHHFIKYKAILNGCQWRKMRFGFILVVIATCVIEGRKPLQSLEDDVRVIMELAKFIQ